LKTLDSYKPKYVKEVLKTLSPTLDDTYTRMLTRIKKMYHQEALTLLRWLAYARSPLTLAELVDAAIIDPDEESSIDTDERGGLRDALNILSGLVTIEENQSDGGNHSETKSFASNVPAAGPERSGAMFDIEHLTSDTRVRLAHFSVKEYLESERMLESGAHQFYLESATGHRVLAQSCLTYLQYYSASCEKTFKQQDLETFPLLRYAAKSWFYHSTLQSGGEVSCETSLLHLEHARDNWLLVHDPDVPSIEPFLRHKYNNGRRVAGSAIYYASLLGLPAVATKLLYNGANVDAEGGRFGSPLQAASAGGHKEIVWLLLNNGAKVDADSEFIGTPLQIASARGDKETVQLLLDKGANVNAEGGEYGSPLQAASAGGHKETVQLLLNKGANVDAEGGEYGSPLQAASARGHKETVQLLLNKGANVDVEGGNYGTPLQTASARDDKEIVQLLLDNGANVNAEGGEYGSPLQAASARGHKETVQLLLNNGANVDTVGGRYGSPLEAASALGHKETVQLLLNKGANVDVEDEFIGTPLQAASA
jgi:ankyrin repeat protein